MTVGKCCVYLGLERGAPFNWSAGCRLDVWDDGLIIESGRLRALRSFFLDRDACRLWTARWIRARRAERLKVWRRKS